MKSSFFGLLATLSGRRKFLLLFVVCLFIIILIIILSLQFYFIIWNDIFYKYFWGPIEADKEGHPIDNIVEGYNFLNTIVYAALLISCIFLMYKVVNKFGIEINNAFIYVSLPFFIFGGVSRSLEDALLFDGALQYLFISPIIYIFMIFLFSVTAAVGIISVKTKSKYEKFASIPFVIFLLSILAATILVSNFSSNYLNYSLPMIFPIAFALFSIIGFAIFFHKKFNPFTISIFFTGTFLLSMSMAYALSFFASTEWQSFYRSETLDTIVTQPAELLIIPAIAFSFTLGLYVVDRLCDKKHALLSTPVNIVLAFSQLLDGVATYRGIDFYGYGEKHVLPELAINLFGSAFVLIIIKLVLIIIIVWLIDVAFRSEFVKYPNLSNIVKFVLIFLGLAPGVRDSLRIAMGV
ncbi:MAG: DUF63 family protein [Methanomassiliicoccales archaeon]